jgi:hypothetical protein
MRYIFEHEGRQYTPDGVVDVPNTEAYNRDLEKQELEYWSAKPDRWQGYVVNDKITTFLGTVIGTVHYSRKYTDGLGHRMHAIRFRGTNGESYYGRYGCDWAQFCRFRKFK